MWRWTGEGERSRLSVNSTRREKEYLVYLCLFSYIFFLLIVCLKGYRHEPPSIVNTVLVYAYYYSCLELMEVPGQCD